MALTDFQRGICRLVADQRKEAGVSYVAGGAALNLLLDSGRVSRDIDVFHDAEAAVHASFAADRRLLEFHGCGIETVRELPAFIEAVIRNARDEVRMEWARDSAFRFVPLMEHEDLGLTLHPFDLATNKVLAMVGRLEVRDWVDAISSHERLQPMGTCCGQPAARTRGSVPAPYWSMRAGRPIIRRRRSRSWRSRAVRPTPTSWR